VVGRTAQAADEHPLARGVEATVLAEPDRHDPVPLEIGAAGRVAPRVVEEEPLGGGEGRIDDHPEEPLLALGVHRKPSGLDRGRARRGELHGAVLLGEDEPPVRQERDVGGRTEPHDRVGEPEAGVGRGRLAPRSAAGEEGEQGEDTSAWGHARYVPGRAGRRPEAPRLVTRP
jgi:hypothetical protein